MYIGIKDYTREDCELIISVAEKCNNITTLTKILLRNDPLKPIYYNCRYGNVFSRIGDADKRCFVSLKLFLLIIRGKPLKVKLW